VFPPRALPAHLIVTHAEAGWPTRSAIAAVQPTADGLGYFMASASGSVYCFGDATWYCGLSQASRGSQERWLA
jgi:hypothetical protein